MKYSKVLVIFLLLLLANIVGGCARSSTEVWDDTKTAGRYVGRGLRSLGGKQGESRQVTSRHDFGYAANYNDDFIPLEDGAEYNKLAMREQDNIPQSRNTPGEPNSTLPGIEAFQDPRNAPELAALFNNVQFAYNSELVKGEQNLQILHKIANYLKKHSEMYVFIEGHCDERGPQAYNLALGTRRSNAVRTFLVKEGVNLDHLFTISYGKERPLVFGDTEDSFRMNRRAQFKVYQR